MLKTPTDVICTALLTNLFPAPPLTDDESIVVMLTSQRELPVLTMETPMEYAFAPPWMIGRMYTREHVVIDTAGTANVTVALSQVSSMLEFEQDTRAMGWARSL